MDTFIKKTLPYIGMVLVVIDVGFFAKQNHNSFEKTIVSQTQRQLLNAVRVEGRLLEQRLSNLTQELEILSENEEVQDVFADGPGRKAVPGFSQLDDSYRDVKSQTVSLSMIDAKGVVIYEVPSKENTGKNLISDADVRKVLTDHKVYADGVVKDALGAYIQAYDQPVFRQGKFVGLLRAVIALETLQSFVSRHEEGDNYSFLLNKEGCLLSYPDQHYLGENLTTLFQDNNLSLKNSKFDALLERVNKGESGSGTCVFFPQSWPRCLAIHPSIMMTRMSSVPALPEHGVARGTWRAFSPRVTTHERIASSLTAHPHSAASDDAFSKEPVSTAVQQSLRCRVGVSR